MAGHASVRLSLVNEPENVLIVRQVLTGLGESLDLDAVLLNSVVAAVSEACNNVVVHAYGGRQGPLEIDVDGSPSALRVTVRDHGRGFSPGPSAFERARSGGVGLLTISSLAQRAEFRPGRPTGTELEMEFPTPDAARLGDAAVGDEQDVASPPADAADYVAIEVSSSGVARAVLPRLLSTLAARAHFPVDRISEVILLADALAAAMRPSPARRARIRARSTPRTLDMLLGPLPEAQVERLLGGSRAGSLGPLLERLAGDHRVVATDEADVLSLRVSAGV